MVAAALLVPLTGAAHGNAVTLDPSRMLLHEADVPARFGHETIGVVLAQKQQRRMEATPG
jgi:hypothetical protein